MEDLKELDLKELYYKKREIEFALMLTNALIKAEPDKPEFAAELRELDRPLKVELEEIKRLILILEQK